MKILRILILRQHINLKQFMNCISIQSGKLQVLSNSAWATAPAGLINIFTRVHEGCCNNSISRHNKSRSFCNSKVKFWYNLSSWIRVFRFQEFLGHVWRWRKISLCQYGDERSSGDTVSEDLHQREHTWGLHCFNYGVWTLSSFGFVPKAFTPLFGFLVGNIWFGLGHLSLLLAWPCFHIMKYIA